METALFISSRDRSADEPTLDRLLRSDPCDYDRIYVGTESCEHALPSPPRLARLQGHCARLGRPLTLITPILTNRGLAAVERLLEPLEANTEVVFNDWGCLEPIRAAGCTPVHGRLLNRCTRDPRLDPALYPDTAVSHLRSSVLHDPGYQRFLEENGVAMVELDNVRQGFSPPPESCLPASLYVPYVHVSTTRYCGGVVPGDCASECYTNVTDTEGAPTFVWGTATFFAHARIDTWTEQWPIDRLVRQVGPLGLAAFVDAGGSDSFVATRAACEAPEAVATLPR